MKIRSINLAEFNSFQGNDVGRHMGLGHVMILLMQQCPTVVRYMHADDDGEQF